MPSKTIVLHVLICVLLLSLVGILTAKPAQETSLRNAQYETGGNLAAVANIDQRLEAELITLKRSGFEPGEVSRPAGRFILVVHNRSGLEEMNLDLVRESGERVRNVRVHRRKLDWKEVITLPPGVYVLRELNNPQWTCRITIAPH